MNKKKFMNPWWKRLFRSFSIQQRLPLLICILLLSVVVAFSWASYIGVKRASLVIAGDRLRSLTEQLSSIFAQSLKAGTIATRSIASQPAVREYLQSGGKGTDTAALSALQKLQTDTQSLFVELLDTDRHLILRAGRPGIEINVDRKTILSDLPVEPDSCRIGKLYHIHDSLYHPIIATVTHNKQTIGYIIRWRSFFATKEALKQFSGLLGANAALYMGNADGSAWTDMTSPVEAPPVNHILDSSRYFEYSRRGASPVIAMARPIANTSLLLLLEFPQQKILEGANRFLSWILIIGGIITVIGITVAWIISRNITKPLKKLTTAATAIAGGNYTASVEVNRNDEIGKLARAFNSMAVQVSNAQQHLEKKVIERTSQLETVNKELEAFTYSVSHDLRAPLRAIIGFTAILEEDYSTKLDDEAKRITSVIKSNTLKMGHLIDGLLTFSRMERQDIEKMKIHTTIMVHEVIDHLQQQNAEHSVEWLIHTLPDAKGDINMMRQVWVNLISNAVKYSSKKEHPHIEIGSFVRDGQTIFFIKDNGAGFNEQYKDKLFKVFQRLHSFDEFDGTGIGLALTEKIIIKHGGRIWAESEVDKGASFYFSLPDQ